TALPHGVRRRILPGTTFSLVFDSTPRQDAACHDAPSPPKNSRNVATLPPAGAKSSPDAPLATTAPASTSIWMPWNKSPAPPLPVHPRAPCNPSGNDRPPPWASNSPVPPAGAPASSSGRNAPFRCRAPNCNRANPSATVPTAAGTFSPQRPVLRLDGHGYSP